MIRLVKLQLLIVLSTFLWTGQFAQAEMLTAEVAHSATIPAAPAPLRAGASFSEKALPQKGTIGSWYLIPPWMPGMWHRDVETTTYPPEDIKTITAPVDESWGNQVDKVGHCWNYHCEPFLSQQAGGNYVDYQTVMTKEVLQMDPTIGFVMRYVAMTQRVSKPDNIVRDTYQQEEIQKITLVEPGLIRRDSSVQFFDEMGRPKGAGKAYTFMKLVQPFQRIDMQNGIDLRQDFKNYLNAHGMQALIPTQ